MSTWKGWQGKVLRVNLTKGECALEDLDRKIAEQFIGGRGVGTKYLCNEVDPKCNALGADNKLIMATGPLTGTMAVSGARYMVITKSPLTGGIACSNSGGYFGPELKFCGIDMIIFEGRAKKPVYLWIDNGKAELLPADDLWGTSAHATTDTLQERHGDEAKVACIGPAGEKQVLLACIMNDRDRAAGRSGVGAVMGSKNLKAVAVRGYQGIKVAKPEQFMKDCRDAIQKLKESPTTAEGLPTYGTAVLVNVINASGLLPTRNFREGQFEGAEATSGETLAETLLVRNKACFSCEIACGRVTAIKEGPYAGTCGEGPEYETDWALGACCGIDDLAAITKANYICNELGFDPISAGVTVACAMELSELGIIPVADTGGKKLRFGDAAAMVECIRQMGLREGFGDKLAQGSYRLAEMYGKPEYSMTVKKQEFPAYDGRGAQGMGIQYATSNRGACHVRGYMIAPEILGTLGEGAYPPNETKGKAELDILFQNLTAAVDASGICLFTTFGIGGDELAAQLASGTGVAEYTVEGILKCGERIWNQERLFNLAAGWTSDDDNLPPRLLKEPMPEGPAKGQVVRLDEMLPEYYKLRGWNNAGVPLKETLKGLDLA